MEGIATNQLPLLGTEDTEVQVIDAISIRAGTVDSESQRLQTSKQSI